MPGHFYQEERKAEALKIIDIRNEDDDSWTDISVRWRQTLSNASYLLELIDWSEKMYERPFTCKLKTSEKENFVEKPIQAPKCPSHGQSIKRCIKQINESSSKAYTLEKREVFIRIQEAIKELFDKCCWLKLFFFILYNTFSMLHKNDKI